MEERFVARFAHANEERNGFVGDLNDVVDEVHVRVPSRGVGTKRFFLEVGQPVVVGVKHHIAGMSVVGSEVVPFGHSVLTVESALEGVDHGLVQKQAVPVSVKRVEQDDLATGGLNAGRVEGFPAVVQAVVVGVRPLRVRTQFLFCLVGQTVSVRVPVRALVGVGPGFGFVFLLGLIWIVLDGINLDVFRLTVVERIEAVLDFPSVTHPVVVGVRVVNIGPVLSFLEFVRKTVAVGVDGGQGGLRIASDVLFNGAFESADVLAGLEEP